MDLNQLFPLNPEPLLEEVYRSFARGDVESHLCALVLNSDRREAWPSTAWKAKISELLAEDRMLSALDTSAPAQAVARLGVRLVLGADQGQSKVFSDLARRELRRQPLPPAATVQDDERLLLGVAAGIGVAAPELTDEFERLVRARRGETVRDACVNAWAGSLARGSVEFDSRSSAYALAAIQPDASRGRLEDVVAVFWTCCRLLSSAKWTADNSDIKTVLAIAGETRRGVLSRLLSKTVLSPLDCAFLLDALCTGPQLQLERRSALGDVLRVVDAFRHAAAALSNRQRERPSFEIGDEYDVQDLFHALVIPIVPDIVPENPIPKLAGRSSRLDFSSKSVRLGFEVKCIRNPRHAKEVRNEILLDMTTYQEHPQIDNVVVLVHDPGGFLPMHERAAFEADLSPSVSIGGRTVTYHTRVR